MRSGLARSIWSQVVAIVLIVPFAGAAHAADKVTLEKSVAISGKKADKTSFAGRVVAYDDDGFELRTKSGEVENVRWDDLDAKTHYVVQKNLIDPKDAEAQMRLGRELLGVEGGKEYSDKA